MSDEHPAARQGRLLQIHGGYVVAAIVLLVTEILIALNVHDRWIRPHGGDVLVVVLLYCLVRAFLKVPVLQAVVGVLLFSFAIELLQYLHFVDRIGLGRNRLAVTIIGTSFEWLDIASYALGAALVLLCEWARGRI